MKRQPNHQLQIRKPVPKKVMRASQIKLEADPVFYQGVHEWLGNIPVGGQLNAIVTYFARQQQNLVVPINVEEGLNQPDQRSVQQSHHQVHQIAWQGHPALNPFYHPISPVDEPLAANNGVVPQQFGNQNMVVPVNFQGGVYRSDQQSIQQSHHQVHQIVWQGHPALNPYYHPISPVYEPLPVSNGVVPQQFGNQGNSQLLIPTPIEREIPVIDLTRNETPVNWCDSMLPFLNYELAPRISEIQKSVQLYGETLPKIVEQIQNSVRRGEISNDLEKLLQINLSAPETRLQFREYPQCLLNLKDPDIPEIYLNVFDTFRTETVKRLYGLDFQLLEIALRIHQISYYEHGYKVFPLQHMAHGEIEFNRNAVDDKIIVLLDEFMKIAEKNRSLAEKIGVLLEAKAVAVKIKKSDDFLGPRSILPQWPMAPSMRSAAIFIPTKIGTPLNELTVEKIFTNPLPEPTYAPLLQPRFFKNKPRTPIPLIF